MLGRSSCREAPSVTNTVVGQKVLSPYRRTEAAVAIVPRVLRILAFEGLHSSSKKKGQKRLISRERVNVQPDEKDYLVRVA